MKKILLLIILRINLINTLVQYDAAWAAPIVLSGDISAVPKEWRPFAKELKAVWDHLQQYIYFKWKESQQEAFGFDDTSKSEAGADDVDNDKSFNFKKLNICC